jgi:site-specific recombinase XerD
MAKFYHQMLMEMELRNFSPRTIEAYVWHLCAFAKMFGKPLDKLGENEIRQYLHHLKTVKKVSSSNINVGYCALRFFYEKVLRRVWNTERLPRPKIEKRLPVVLSREEVQTILDAVANLKHQTMLMTTYAAGLRVSETVHLKLADIDSKRMMIRVEQGKGKKDRYTLLSPTLLEKLRVYYQAYRPALWLFPGSRPGQPIGVASVQKAFQCAKKKSAS